MANLDNLTNLTSSNEKTVILLDNKDSFVHNLARLITNLGFKCLVLRSDKISLQDLIWLDINNKISHLVISPGPKDPKSAGVSNRAVEYFGAKIPILGVCLGHQVIANVYGAKIVKALMPMHGKAAPIIQDDNIIFSNLPSKFMVGRYHSLIVCPENLPGCLKVTSRSIQGEIMAIRHTKYPVYGVQFHPESILSQYGYQIINNFLKLSAFGRKL